MQDYENEAENGHHYELCEMGEIVQDTTTACVQRVMAEWNWQVITCWTDLMM